MKKERELLRKQLELLAEQSNGAVEDDLASLSSAMVEIYDRLEHPIMIGRLALLFLVLSNLVVSILILVK